MTKIKELIHAKALELHAQNQHVDVVTLEQAIEAGAALIVGDVINIIKTAGEDMKKERLKAGAPQ